MTRETYERMTDYMKSNPRKLRLIKRVNHLLTGIVFCVYPLFLMMLFWEKEPFLFRAILVPAVSFATVTIFRYILNVPRPYEKFGIKPALDKDTSGKSFPSRHVFSVFMIASTIFVVHLGAGVLLGIVGVILAVVRVVGGVHEIRDVIAGAVIAICFAGVGYYLIP